VDRQNKNAHFYTFNEMLPKGQLKPHEIDTSAYKLLEKSGNIKLNQVFEFDKLHKLSG